MLEKMLRVRDDSTPTPFMPTWISLNNSVGKNVKSERNPCFNFGKRGKTDKWKVQISHGYKV